MKHRSILLLVAAFTFGSFAFADIQSSPGQRWGWSRKLSRALANIAYGVTEYPVTWVKSNRLDGSSAAWSTMAVDGTKRSVVRLGYGVFELVTFPFPVYKGTYRPPYYAHEKFDPYYGYDEFPPQFGHSSQASYCRVQDYHPF
ncbi:MAG TPA: exosortase system-associated protein, TIGR04073 family [Verrucomicrobiaceae bacterium]|jgi:putative exosortase-associated protein (TIGR04073 family)